MKNKKNDNSIKNGISLVVLVIIVIVMSMLVSMTVVNTKDILQETGAREFASELKQLEYLVRQSKILNDNKNVNTVVRTLSLSDLTSEQEEQMSEEIGTSATQITLYELDLKAIGANDTIYGKKENEDSNDVYLVSYDTGKVYYLKGFAWKDKMHYTLTDELKELIAL